MDDFETDGDSHDSGNLESDLDRTDPGDDTQRRFRYQACVAANYALGLLSTHTDFTSVYCEHHEDILLELRSGKFIGIQVKTRLESRPPLRATDETIHGALARFVLKDRAFPGKFDRFQIVTNSGFSEGSQDQHNLPYLLDLIERSDDESILANTWVEKLVHNVVRECKRRLGVNSNAGLVPIAPVDVLFTLRKTSAFSNAGLDDIETRVIRTTSKVDVLRSCTSALVEKMAMSLIAHTTRAAARPTDPAAIDRASIQPNPAQALEQEALREKKITAETVFAIFAECGVYAAFNAEGEIVQRPLAAETHQTALQLLPDNLSDRFLRQPTMLLSTPEPTDIPSVQANNPYEREAATQFEILSKLIESGHARAALDVVDRLRANLWSKVPAEMRAKIANSQAGVAFLLNDLAATQKHLEEAHAYDRQNVTIQVNLASIALLNGQPKAALEYAEAVRRRDELNENAVAVYLQALHNLGEDERLNSVLSDERNAWINVSPVCRAALASVASDKKEWLRAKELLRSVLGGSDVRKQDPQHLMLLGKVIVSAITEEMAPEQRIPEDLTQQARADLEEAEKAYSDAISILSDHDSPAWHYAVLTSRSGVRFMLGKNNDALQDCDRVLYDEPNNLGALENKGRILMAMDRADEAVRCLEALWDLLQTSTTIPAGLYTSNRQGYERFEAARTALALAYTRAEKPAKVLALLSLSTTATMDDAPQSDRFLRTELLLYAASQMTGDDAKRTELASLEYLRAASATDARAHMVLAHYEDMKGNAQSSLVHLRAAVDMAPISLKARYQRVLARHLYDAGAYTDSVHLLRPLIGSDGDDPDLPLFVYCLYRAELRSEALETAQRVRRSRGAKAGVSDIEVELLEKAGDLPEARAVLKELVEAEPAAHQYRIRLAYLELRAGDREAAQRLTSSIAYDEVSGHPQLLINVARLRSALAMPECLRYGYRARRLAFDDPDVHSEYVGMFNSLDSNQGEGELVLQEKTVVEAGYAVCLARDGESRWVVLEPEQPVAMSRNEIPSDDELALRLIGRALHDKVSMPGAFSDGIEYEITGIKHRYLYALHDDTERMADGRLINPCMQVFRASTPEDIDRVLSAISRRGVKRRDPWPLHERNQLPFASLAISLNCSVIDLHLAVTGSPQGFIVSFLFNAEENERNRELLLWDGSVDASLDLTALMSITRFNLESQVHSSFRRLIVARSVVDHLTTYEQHLNTPIGAEAAVMLPDNETYFLRREERLAAVRRLLNFIGSSVQIVPTSGLLEADPKFLKLVGEPALAALLAAQEQQAVLYSDDLWLRLYASSIAGVKGVNTEIMLQDQREHHGLSKIDHARTQVALARSHYRYVYMDAELLLSILEGNEYHVDDDVRASFKLFEGPECRLTSALGAMTAVIKDVWYRNLLEQHQVEILDLALKTLTTGRHRQQVVRQWLPILANALYIAPTVFVRVNAHVRIWLTGNDHLP